MIKKITVRKSGLSATFLNYQAFLKEYGYDALNCKTTREKIAFEENAYLRILNNEVGFYSLTTNTTNAQKGIDEDGSSFLNNYYSNRQLIWQFEWFPSTARKLDSVLYQSNDLLSIEIETENDVYLVSQATLVGRFEGGTIEIDCFSAFFQVQGGNVTDCFVIPLVNGEIKLIDEVKYNGFLVNNIYFGEDLINNIFNINANVFAEPVFTITGGWQNLVVTNLSSGTVLTINGTCTNECIVDCENQTVTIDGVDYTNVSKGLYPSLISGNNQIKFDFDTKIADVEICYNYLNLVGSVF